MTNAEYKTLERLLIKLEKETRIEYEKADKTGFKKPERHPLYTKWWSARDALCNFKWVMNPKLALIVQPRL